MDLPHELLDEILDYLPLNNEQDERSMRNYSLIARSWVNPSRRRLFKAVEFREETLQLWLANIPSANGELLQHVRSLSYIVPDREPRLFVQPLRCDLEEKYHPDILRDYLPSFNQLQHLSLSYIYVSSSGQVEMFSAFRHTLSRLTLDHCIVTFSAFVTLINNFSNLDRLDIYSVVSHQGYDDPTPLSRPIPKVHIRGCQGRCDLSSLLYGLSKLGPVSEEIAIGGGEYLSVLGLQRILYTVGTNAKRVRLWCSLEEHHASLKDTLLSDCQELRELELVLTHPTLPERAILSSITSTNIQKITFVWMPQWRSLPNDTYWQAYDRPLCRLADRLGRKRKLEVEFVLTDDTKATTVVDSLAAFMEKGRIRVSRASLNGQERVLCPLPSG